MDADRRLRALRQWQRLLDSAFRIPGTRVRFGWDPVLGLIPWAGDLATALIAGVLIVEAHRLRLPRVVQLRMVFNIGIDVLVGLVPFAGDVADIFWKANTRNLELLEQHSKGGGRSATSGDWAFVVVLVCAALAIAAIPLLVVYWALSLTGRPLV